MPALAQQSIYIGVDSKDSLFRDRSAHQLLSYSDQATSSQGAMHASNGVIAGGGFGPCVGLLVRHESGEVSAFHITYGLTQGQQEEMARLQARGGKYQAVFMFGKLGDPDTVALAQAWLKEKLPGTVSKTINLPHGGWEFAYNVEHNRLQTRGSTERATVLDLGNPFPEPVLKR